MKTLKRYMKIYCLLCAQHFKARMEYRADFLISVAGLVVINIAGVLPLWLIFHSIPNLAGWNYNELVFVYAFSLLAMLPVQLLFDNVWHLNNKLLDGSFIKYYFRPLDILFYFTSERIEVKSIGQFVIAAVMLIYASGELDILWDAKNIGIFLLLVISSSLVAIGIVLLASAFGFWVLNSAFTLVFVYKLSGFCHYPMSIYNNSFKFLFTFVIPIGYIAFYPAKLILRSNEADALAYSSPLIGVVLFGIAYYVWVRGAMRYGGTGS
jgi:ABC-2 type transport system permease protein